MNTDCPKKESFDLNDISPEMTACEAIQAREVILEKTHGNITVPMNEERAQAILDAIEVKPDEFKAKHKGESASEVLASFEAE